MCIGGFAVAGQARRGFVRVNSFEQRETRGFAKRQAAAIRVERSARIARNEFEGIESIQYTAA